MIVNNLLDLIGNTPVILYKTINNNDIYLKLEMFNPTGSVKDRAAKNIVLDAIKGYQNPKQYKFVEATSGNIGISLAMIMATKGLDLTIIMPANVSLERIQIIKAYGAKVILSDAKLGMSGASVIAKKMQSEGYIYLDQFNNINNVNAHLQTAKEIINDFKDLDYIVAGIGTAGTISGLAKNLKSHYPNLKIIGVEPAESSVITTGVPGHHKIPGIGAGFVPSFLNLDLIDEMITINSQAAWEMTNQSAKEGLFLGISSNAAILAALEIAKKVQNRKILVIAPDSGNNYKSLGVFNND